MTNFCKNLESQGMSDNLGIVKSHKLGNFYHCSIPEPTSAFCFFCNIEPVLLHPVYK